MWISHLYLQKAMLLACLRGNPQFGTIRRIARAYLTSNYVEKNH